MVSSEPISFYSQRQGSSARAYYHDLDFRIRNTGLVPRLDELTIVTDPESVLNEDEKKVITTGYKDMQKLATFKLMPLVLRFALREGYSFNFVNGDQENYNRRQKEWKLISDDFLAKDLHRDPTREEAMVRYNLCAGLEFFIFYLLDNPEKAHRVVTRLHIPHNISGILDRLARIPTGNLPKEVIAA